MDEVEVGPLSARWARAFGAAYRDRYDADEAVRDLQEVGYYPPGDPQPIALRMLTVVHGVASLLVAKPFLPWGDPMEYADRVISGACLGIALTAGMDELPDGAGALALVRELRGHGTADPAAG